MGPIVGRKDGLREAELYTRLEMQQTVISILSSLVSAMFRKQQPKRQCRKRKRLKHIESLFCIEIEIAIEIGIEPAGIIYFYEFNFDGDFDFDDLNRQRFP